MIRNYFKIAWRNLLSRKNNTIINICGLSIGIAVCLIIFITIQFEFSFDDYHKKKDRIYRVLTEFHHADVPDAFYSKGVPFAIPRSLKTSFSQIEQVAILFDVGNTQIMVLDNMGQTVKKIKEKKGVFLTEPALFNIFDFEWIAGTAESLEHPNHVVLTKEIAIKYFGSWENAMGKNIKLNNEHILKVSGVLGSIPINTDLQFTMAISLGTGNSADILKSEDWESVNGNFGCFVLLTENASVTSINTQLSTLSKEMRSSENHDSQKLQSLSQIHFDTQVGNFSNKTISHKLINVLWIIAGLILLIACVNFINLSTAQTINRFKEIGVRKVFGGSKQQLTLQFLTETFLIVLLSAFLSFTAASFLLPYTGKLLDLPLSFSDIKYTEVLPFLTVITIIVTLLAGFYPSVVLSKFKPVDALKNKLSTVNSKGINLRRTLVVFQFAIAQILIISTLIIVKQMNYFNNQPLGFNKDAIINISIPTDSISLNKIEYLQKSLKSVNGVRNVSFSSSTPIENDGNHWTNFKFNNASENTTFYAILKALDHEYLETYEIALVAGRNFEESNSTDEFLVNETLLKKLGINDPQEILNKEIDLWDGLIKGSVVGVLKDYHDRSFRDEKAAVLMTAKKNFYTQSGIKLASNEATSALKTIENIWNQTFPEYIFEYQFLDDKIDSYYKQERRFSQMFSLAAIIAILLSCLGLYGLASFMVMQRIKEVGIRKVLGASAGHIVYIFSREYILLILISFCIASPIAWYFMNEWLQDFAYRIDIDWTVYIIGVSVALIIALTTTSFKAIKAARANPVISLKTE